MITPSYSQVARTCWMSLVRALTRPARSFTFSASARASSDFRCAGRYALTRTATAGARASRGSVLIFLPPAAYMSRNRGSAMTTSWPSDSRWRATHSADVDASSKMREPGYLAKDADNSSGRCTRLRSSMMVPSSFVTQTWDLRFAMSSPTMYMASHLLVPRVADPEHVTGLRSHRSRWLAASSHETPHTGRACLLAPRAARRGVVRTCGSRATNRDGRTSPAS